MAATVCTSRAWRSASGFGTVSARACHATELRAQYDALVIGGGHNGLVAAVYLQKGGLNTAVLERRNVLGGVVVSEEIIPGFHFSRAAYLLSLLRPQIYRDLELKKHRLKVYSRDPHAFTPMLEEGVGSRPPRSLLLGSDMEQNQREIRKFSEKDALAFPPFKLHLETLARALHPLLDAPHMDIPTATHGALRERLAAIRNMTPLINCGLRLGKNIPDFHELITEPIVKILNRWFESEPLKATLARDAAIGAMSRPGNPGSGYVLLHRVMGELEKQKGAWGYVEGGMGGVSKAIANSARAHGAAIFTEQEVERILIGPDGCAQGVVLKDGSEVRSKVVLSNATPYVTFKRLTPQDSLPPDFVKAISQIDYTSPITKINVALDRLPNFLAAPNVADGIPGPHHQCSIHLNCESMDVLEAAYREGMQGRPSSRPVMEMCLPSVLDPTLAPPGCHVVSILTQFTPYWLEEGRAWTEEDREQYINSVFGWIERYAPGFKRSVVGKEVLTPPDLERIFGLTGGNIFHDGMSLDPLYLARTMPSISNYSTPIRGLYLCGSGSHPGGGVMGSSGWNAAMTVLKDLRGS